MWLERFLIVVPSLGHKYLPYSWGVYRPRPVEIMITISTFAAMTLLYVLFSKFVPIISIWEMKVGEQPSRTKPRPAARRSRVLGEAPPMSAVYALYPDPESAQRAVNGLHAAGCRRRGHRRHVRRADRGAAVRAAGQGDVAVVHRLRRRRCSASIFSTWLTRMTELAWPLQTGNMPIVAWWPNLIVMFELTMLGAILATVITLFITAKLPRRTPAFYDPEVTNGKILVGVENPSEASVPALERRSWPAALLSSKGDDHDASINTCRRRRRRMSVSGSRIARPGAVGDR